MSAGTIVSLALVLIVAATVIGAVAMRRQPGPGDPRRRAARGKATPDSGYSPTMYGYPASATDARDGNDHQGWGAASTVADEQGSGDGPGGGGERGFGDSSDTGGWGNGDGTSDGGGSSDSGSGGGGDGGGGRDGGGGSSD